MTTRSTKWIFALCFLALICVPIHGENLSVLEFTASAPAAAQHDNRLRTSEPILPIPFDAPLNREKVLLGEQLFKDPILSNNGKVACHDCHYFDKGATDQKRFSKAINGQYRSYNTPTLFNVGLTTILNWEGNHDDLGEITEAIIKSKKGLASDWPELIARLNAKLDYANAFSRIYGGQIRPEHVKDVFAEFLRSLNTPNSRFDQYLRGADDAITKDEKIGYQLFKAYGCASCHQGVNLGGNMFASFSSIFGNYIEDKQNITKSDLGRFNVTGEELDKYVFRVPILRNIALTAPYFHDGSANTLEKAVVIMSGYMLGRDMPPNDVKRIVQFLNTLTGEYKGSPL